MRVLAPTLQLRFIDVADPLYESECLLRWVVLRKPLGMTRAQVAFPFEAEALHLVAVDGERVRGCVLFHPDGLGGGRLFQMAVEPELQGRGIGRALVLHLEEELATRGLQRIELHAREVALGFYERLGYAVFGDPYEEVGIPHRSMEKVLG